MIHTLAVSGKPIAQGSMSAFPGKVDEETGRQRVHQTHSNPLLVPWRNEIGRRFRVEFPRLVPYDEPMLVALIFYVEAPKVLKHQYPAMQGTGDLDKLARGVYDALEGLAYVNDARVVVQQHRAVYHADDKWQGVWITLAPWSEGQALDFHELLQGKVVKR